MWRHDHHLIGLDPQQIVGLIYQHYDPDLCGSMSNFIDMCDNPNLKIISDKNSNMFIAHYIHRDKCHLLDSIDDYGFTFKLNNRTLKFISTPYSHNPGSFVTYDPKTKTLFSSDLFGSYSSKWDLFVQFFEECFTCLDYNDCPNRRSFCPVKEILTFHKTMMPCCKALRYAMNKIKEVDIECIAPQHGSIIKSLRNISFVIQRLTNLEEVGIDAIV